MIDGCEVIANCAPLTFVLSPNNNQHSTLLLLLHDIVRQRCKPVHLPVSTRILYRSWIVGLKYGSATVGSYFFWANATVLLYL